MHRLPAKPQALTRNIIAAVRLPVTSKASEPTSTIQTTGLSDFVKRLALLIAR